MTTFTHGDPVTATVTGTFVSEGSGISHTVVVETSPGQFVYLPDTATVTAPVEKEDDQ